MLTIASSCNLSFSDACAVGLCIFENKIVSDS